MANYLIILVVLRLAYSVKRVGSRCLLCKLLKPRDSSLGPVPSMGLNGVMILSPNG